MYVHLSVHLSVFLLDYVILFLLAMPHFCFLDSGKPTGEICGPNDKCWGNWRCLSRCCEKYLGSSQNIDNVAECDNNGYAKSQDLSYRHVLSHAERRLCTPRFQVEQVARQLDLPGYPHLLIARMPFKSWDKVTHQREQCTAHLAPGIATSVMMVTSGTI